MRASRILIPVLLFIVAACEPVEQDNEYQQTLAEGKKTGGSEYTLTLQATKTVDTKALDLVNGTRLNTYWKNTDKVKVFRNGACVGTLNVSCQGDRPTTAKLSGSVQIHGLAQGDVLTLLIPREIFDYTGQKGVLTGKATIEDTYDYAIATVTVDSINGTTVTTTTDAQFENQQSIYRFGFGPSASLVAQEFTVLSANGKLVTSATYEGNAWTPAYGPITVNPSVPNPISASDNFYYVALQNGSKVADTYSFVIVDNDHKLHLATKEIPADKLGNGKFLTSTSIDAPAVTFTPSGTEITQAY